MLTPDFEALLQSGLFRSREQPHEQLASVNSKMIDPQFLFVLERKCLYHFEQDQQIRETQTQLLVLQKYCRPVMQLMHNILCSGRLGWEETLSPVLASFSWTRVHQEVREYCSSCWHAPKGAPKAPSVPLLLIKTHFERMGMDMVGPLEKKHL